MMKLWLLTQRENRGYDTYDSVVVAAESAEEAREIKPADYGWAPSHLVEAELIGEAIEGTEAGIILASFNAG